MTAAAYVRIARGEHMPGIIVTVSGWRLRD
jgi:hypothetical protein